MRAVIVCVGQHPSFVIRKLRELALENLYVYPEFYDNKSLLLNREYSTYIRKLLELRDRAIIALWPDYTCTRFSNVLPKDIVYIYPVHDLREKECIVKLVEHGYSVVPGYASAPGTRNYRLSDFTRIFEPAQSFYLGAGSRRELREATGLGFWGVDVTTSVVSKAYNKNQPEVLGAFTKLVKKLAGV